jgi:hypothetical protein
MKNIFWDRICFDRNDKITIVPGKVYDLLFPYSRAACAAGVAGTVQTVRVSESGLGVTLAGNGPYFTSGEAGIHHDYDGSLYAYGFLKKTF